MRMKPATMTVFALLVIMTGACSSSSDEAGIASDAGPSGSGGGSGTGGSAGSGTGGDAATMGTADDASGMSAECKEYCDCYEANCAQIQPIPSGASCGDFCATFTPDLWDCRRSHCELVVPEDNPNHCKHAVGIEQCE